MAKSMIIQWLNILGIIRRSVSYVQSTAYSGKHRIITYPVPNVLNVQKLAAVKSVRKGRMRL